VTTALNPAWTAGITGGKGVAGVRYITGLSGSTSAGYFQDQAGSPVFMFGDTPWSIVYQAGADSGTYTYQQDMDYYTATRAAQGYNTLECNLLPNSSYASTEGQTWDGVKPFAGGVLPSGGLTSGYWARLDYLVASAAAQGITMFLNLMMTDDLAGPASTWSDTNFTTYGNLIATRYLSYPNIVWTIGDDYFGYNDPEFSAILTGIRNAGDTRPIGIENDTETTSRQYIGTPSHEQAWGYANANYQWCYSYNVSYLAVEYAYAEASPIPVVRGDGYYYGSGAADDKLLRNHLWWVIASGGRGFCGGYTDGGNGFFASGWRTGLTAGGEESSGSGSYQVHVSPAVAAYMKGLAGWWKLIPDTGNVFITAGRGTRATAYTEGAGSTPSYTGTADTYVAGSIAPDGSLAVIYFSEGVSTTITVNQSKMTTGYSAHWVDPANCAVTTGTAGGTYTKPAGANSAGDHDWVLVLSYP